MRNEVLSDKLSIPVVSFHDFDALWLSSLSNMEQLINEIPSNESASVQVDLFQVSSFVML